MARTVIGQGTNHLHHKPTATHGLRAATNTEVGMLPQKAVIFLMNTDNILDNERGTIVFHEGSWLKVTHLRSISNRFGMRITGAYQIMDLAETIAPE